MTFESAYSEYLARKRGKSPQGFIQTGHGRNLSFRLSDSARLPCCDNVEEVSLPAHVKTATHIAREYGLDPDDFRRFVKRQEIRKTRRMRQGEWT